MKHHQPWLCEQVSALHRPAGGIKKNLYKEFSSKTTRKLKQAEQSLGSLSDLLLALQDELGQMSLCVSVFRLYFISRHFVIFFFFSFLREYQDLLGQLDVVQHREEREDLKLELESLVTRMEEKGAQITKLRKHWQMVSSDEIWSTCTLVFSTTLMLYYTTLIFNTFRVSFTQVVWICHKHICNRSETDFYWSQVHLLSYLM